MSLMSNKRSPIPRIYLVRRAVALALLALGLSLGIMPRLMAADSGQESGSLRIHVVSSGETLWEIASSQTRGDDPRAYIQRLQVINGLDGAMVHPGQRLKLP